MKEFNKSSRHRLTVKYLPDSVVRSMVVGTRPNNWINTTENVIIAISIHSRFNEGIDGYFKLSALVNTVKSRVRGKITILFCEGAHINVLSLKFNNTSDALIACRRDAEKTL